MTNWTKYRYNPRGAPSVCTIADEHGDLMAVLDGENWEIGTNEEIDERAKLICRAVNSHAALVEALEATRTQLEYTGNGKPAQSEQWPGLYSQVLDALTLGKGA